MIATVGSFLHDLPVLCLLLAIVLGTAIAFLVPIEEGATPQWAFATAATTGQLSDITDWQRWLIHPDGTRVASPTVYGTDVRP